MVLLQIYEIRETFTSDYEILEMFSQDHEIKDQSTCLL